MSIFIDTLLWYGIIDGAPDTVGTPLYTPKLHAPMLLYIINMEFKIAIIFDQGVCGQIRLQNKHMIIECRIARTTGD